MVEKLTLIEPTEAMRDAYMDFLADFARAGEETTDGMVSSQGWP